MTNTKNNPSNPQPETYDVFNVTQITRDTVLENDIAADYVTLEPHKNSEIHRHNKAETVIYILEGTGTIRVGENDVDVKPGDRIYIPKGTFHGVSTNENGLKFISIQMPPILDKSRDHLDLEPLIP